MINNLPNDIILYTIKLFHRFTYLYILLNTNKNLNNKTKQILYFHLNNFNKCLNISNKSIINSNKNTYLFISKYLFYNKIINIKKFNTKFLLSLHNQNIPIFVKHFLVIDNYYDNNILKKYITILPLKYILLQDTTTYISFIIFYIKVGFVIQIQFYNNTYRMKLKCDSISTCLYKPITENTILTLFTKKNMDLLKYFR